MKNMWTLLFVVATLASSCATASQTQETLSAPGGSTPAARNAVDKGNALFAEKRYAEARVQYEAALVADPRMAEAHYNLALTLDRMGQGRVAEQHYLEAADLAPGHKVIWDSPPLREHGKVEPGTSSSSSDPVFSPLGGVGTGGPSGGPY